MKCCVIGGAGFIGRALTSRLAKSGRDVVVMGRSPSPGEALQEHVRYERGDYGDRATLRKILAGADEIIDLAYSTAPQTSYTDPIFDLLGNLPPSVTLLQEAASLGVKKVVVVSSGGTVYGIARSLPIKEDHPTNPISPYGITKLALEHYALMFHVTHGLPVIIVRPANAYGEGQRRHSGQGFIATAMERVKQGQVVEVYGPQGTVRDYIHVTDVATGIMAALEHGHTGRAYNIGTGQGHSNIDILRMMEPLATQLRLKVQVKVLPPRKFDVPANVLDSSELREASGWTPQVPLEQGISSLWRAVIDG